MFRTSVLMDDNLQENPHHSSLITLFTVKMSTLKAIKYSPGKLEVLD